MTEIHNGFVPLEAGDYNAVGMSATEAKENPFMIAQRQLDEAARILKLDDATHQMLNWPLREMHARLPVRMDDGSIKVFHAFRVQYNDARGPCKGGIRFHPSETIDTVRALAAWMMDEFSFIEGHNEFGMITGKPLPLGGSEGRGDATARGGVYVMREAAKVAGLDLTQATYAIQGLGNAGSNAAKIIADEVGGAVIAIGELDGTIFNAKGLDVHAVHAHFLKTRGLKGFTGGDFMPNPKACLELKCDVVVPAAIENQITHENVDRVKAKIVLELANGPTTPEADAVLAEKKIVVLPDFLANAGGVTVSYFEMVQNAYSYYWDLDVVQDRLSRKMTHAFQAVHAAATKHQVPNRLAAYLVAVSRVAEAMKLRGWV